MDNTKNIIDVPAKYLDKANFPGPFTAGVNQVIPYHLFAGDGMLTRLILKASDKAPWSDKWNKAKKSSSSSSGEIRTWINTSMKQTQKEHKENKIKNYQIYLKKMEQQSYKATIKVYGRKRRKADLTNLVALKEVTVNLT